MESVRHSVNASIKGKKSEKSRRSWSVKEEEALIDALKVAVGKGLKSENGFRCGYLGVLEEEIKRVFPDTDIRANPHINSRIHVWKKTHGSLVSMLSRSGIGWNDTDKMIEATDEAWDAYVKSDSNARLMRNKCWPYYNDWCEIFGNDRATGEHVESLACAFQDVLNMSHQVAFDNDLGLHDMFNDVEEACESMSVSQTPLPTGTAGKKFNSKKRKQRTEDGDDKVAAIKHLADVTKSTMSDLVKVLGNDEKMATEMDKVFDALATIDDLNTDERVLAAEMLVENPKKMAIFLRLDNEGRQSLMRRLLG